MKTLAMKMAATIGIMAASLAAAPAYSASIFFTPSSQLDSDPIEDAIATTGANGFSLSIKVDTSGLSSPLKSLLFEGVRDEAELASPNPVQTPESLALLGPVEIVRDQTDLSKVVFTVNFPGGQGIAPDTILELLNVSYSVPQLVNDGKTDFSVSKVISATTVDGSNVTSKFAVPTSGIDVQASVPEPASVLGLLAFGALGATLKGKKKLVAQKAEA